MAKKSAPKKKAVLVKDTPKATRLHHQLATGTYKGPKKASKK